MNNLHPIAQAVQSQGRGNDTQLVHMTPGEVAGMQALAKAHGGSLSINPSTGLPEAGFLESLLPTILGAGLAAATGGSSLMIGGGLGALQYARTGSLEKGLMAGLGAYGGAGLGAGLAGAGATAGSQTMTNLAAEQASQLGKAKLAEDVATKELAQAAAKKAGENLALQQANALGANTFSQNLSNMGTGLKTAFSSPTTFMEQFGGAGKDLAMSAGAAAAPTLLQQPRTVTPPADNEQFRYSYDPGRVSEEDLAAQRAANPYGELKYFRPTYGPRQTVQVAQGGEIGYADGGTIDLSGTINLGGQGARGGASAGMPNNSFTPMSGGLMGGLGALAFPDEIPRSSLVREHGGVSGNPMMLSNTLYDGLPIKNAVLEQTYEEYLAGRHPLQAVAPLTREQFENPSYSASGGSSSSMFAKGGEIGYADGGTSDYEYDPATQTYKKKVSAPVGAVPSVGVPGSGGDREQPLSKQTIDFLDNEDKSPGGARDQRMGKINDILNMLAPGSIARALVRGGNSLTGGGVGDTRAPVSVSSGTTGMTPNERSFIESGGYTTDVPSADQGGYDPTSGYDTDTDMAKGGIAGLAAGGMSKGGFVVPADVVSALGNGSTDAGLRALNKKLAATPIKGKGDGLSDSIPTSIDGKQPARVADGEAYISPQTVAKIGGGDAKKGAKKLYAMMDRVRQQAHGKKSQQRRVNPNTAV